MSDYTIKDVRPPWDQLSQNVNKELERKGVKRLTRAEQAKLHYDWQVHGDQEAYEILSLYSMKFVYKIANKLRALGKLYNGSQFDDAVSNGAFAVIESLQKWNPNQGSLSTYIWSQVRGEIVWSNRKDRLRGLAGRPDLQEYLGGAGRVLSEEWTYANGMDMDVTVKSRFDQAVDHEANPVLDAAIHMELNDFVRERLTPIQQKVIKLLYVEDMTQAEAGLIIGRTQQRVDQIHREALEVLRSIYL